jgi:protein-disulfide isomerase
MTDARPLDLAAPVDAVDHGLGPEHAPVTLVEYGDFECPNCKQAAPAVEMLIKRFGNRVRFVYRHFPLEEVHPHAFAAAEAAESAGAQGEFWDMYKCLFAHQTHLEHADLHRYAEEIGLDMGRFVTEMNDHIYLPRVREHIDSGRRSGVRSTPGFFINGRLHDVSFGLLSLFDATEAELKRRT